ncbi:MAG: hypothetical protein B7Z75_06160 [Acidocella sp. 20-57-95]|nr:MAG: hypothetical protein B7Z75_06160 [Acidocella sp. 20-57-95]HQT63471.1 alpha/beta hydrolase [Acidocella sp.]
MPVTSFASLTTIKEDGRVTVAPGVELSYADRGTGQAIVLIPGWTFSKNVFEKQIEPLSQKYRVIAYDPRSQGASSFTLEGNDYMTHAEDLAHLLEALKVSNPVLVGWGAGTHTAFGLARLKGVASLAALIAIDMPPRSLAFERHAWTEGSFDEVSAIHSVYLRDMRGQTEFLRHYVEKILIQRNLELHELSWIIAQALKTHPLVASQLFASCMFSDNTASAISVARSRPLLYIIAQHWAEKAKSHLAAFLPEARTVSFGGRMMFWEYPDQFNKVVDEFIQHHVAGTATGGDSYLDDRFGHYSFHDAGVEGLERRVPNRFI